MPISNGFPAGKQHGRRSSQHRSSGAMLPMQGLGLRWGGQKRTMKRRIEATSGSPSYSISTTTTKQEQTTQAAARVKKSTCRVRHHHTHPCTSGQPTNTKRKNRCAHKVATRPKRSWLPCPRLDRCRGRRDPTSKRRMRHQISSARTRCVLAPTPSQHFRSPSAL